MRTLEIDPTDDAAFERWFGPIAASEHDLFPEHPGWLAHELAAFGPERIDAKATYLAVEDDDGRSVGAALVRIPTLDNRDVADVFICDVHPDHRRRGVGSELVAHVERVARQEGRTTVVIGSEERAGSTNPAVAAFAESQGFEVGLRSSKRQLDLPADPGVLGRLEHDATPHAADYEIVTWLGGCPDKWLEGRLELAAGMSTDTPHDDLDVEPELWDEARLRAQEQLADVQRRTRFAAGAVHVATDRLVGFTDLAVSTVEPTVGQQYDTIVAGPHRGHRLGVLVKIANLRAVMAGSPGTKRLHTWNADANDPMISVNESLGFFRVSRGRIWKKTLA